MLFKNMPNIKIKSKKFKAVVIGCGRIGAEERKADKRIKPITHAGVWTENPDTDLVALADSNKKKLQTAGRLFPGARLYADASEMLKKECPDIVSVAAPSYLHKDLVFLAASFHPRAILCEKPIALSVLDAQEMIKNCRQNKVLLFINHQRRFDSLLNKWAKKVKKGVIGDLLQGNAYYYNGLMNAGTHLIDLILNFVGQKPKSVTAYWNTRTTKDASDKNADGVIKFSGDFSVAIQSVTPDYGLFGLRLVGDKGLIETPNVAFNILYQKKIKNKTFAGFYDLGKPEIEGGYRSMYKEVGIHIAACLKGLEKPCGTGEDALRVLKVLEAIKKSADLNGAEIKITL